LRKLILNIFMIWTILWYWIYVSLVRLTKMNIMWPLAAQGRNSLRFGRFSRTNHRLNIKIWKVIINQLINCFIVMRRNGFCQQVDIYLLLQFFLKGSGFYKIFLLIFFIKILIYKIFFFFFIYIT